jgi:hypothetical protein
MVPAVAVVDITGEVPECLEVAVVMAAAAAVHPMRIKPWLQRSRIPEEITIPTDIVTFRGQDQDAVLHWCQLRLPLIQHQRLQLQEQPFAQVKQQP